VKQVSCYDSLLEGICDLLRKDRVYRSKAFEALEVLEQRPFLLVHFKSEEEVRIPFVEVYGQQPKIKTERHCLEEKILMAFEWQKILDNSLIYRVVQVGHTPFRDADLDKNPRKAEPLCGFRRMEPGTIPDRSHGVDSGSIPVTWGIDMGVWRITLRASAVPELRELRG